MRVSLLNEHETNESKPVDEHETNESKHVECFPSFVLVGYKLNYKEMLEKKNMNETKN